MIELGEISDSDSYMERTFMSPAWNRAAKLIEEWMIEAGLEVRMDEVGNIHGRTPAEKSNPGPALYLGSHFDTVIDGGKYDGALGVVTAINAVKALFLSTNDTLLRPIEIIAIGDEDSSRFASFFSSRILTGELIRSNELNTLVDDSGKSLSEVLTENGLDGSPEAVAKAAI